MKHNTSVERRSDRELVVTRVFDAPPAIVFKAWTTPALFMRWWAPRSTGMSLISCEMDVRMGGGYRIELGHPSSDRPMVFFGKYIDVTPPARLAWTNEESEFGAVTTVTFEDSNGKTLLTLREVYPTKQALDNSFEGMESGMPEQFTQLDDLLEALATSAWKS